MGMSGSSSSSSRTTKLVCLASLTFVNSGWALSMSYARARNADKFISSTAVLMAEVCKLVGALALVMVTEGTCVNGLRKLRDNIWKDKMGTVRVAVPAFVYLVQNNLLYLAASCLDAATYQVTYQLKILTTAMFATAIMGTVLAGLQWLALGTLCAGVVAVQLAAPSASGAFGEMDPNKVLGMTAAVGASVCSGFAGIYFEKILKGSDVSIWMRNVQLSLASLPLGLLTSLAYDWQDIRNKGFFFGYDSYVAYLVALNALGGLLVAMVVKYADNILKNFATSLAIVLSMLVSIMFFGFLINLQYILGTGLVITSIFLYSYGAAEQSASYRILETADVIEGPKA